MNLNDRHGPALIIGPAWVGDMIMAQSLFITLRQLHPERPVDVLAPAWSLPLLERMPEVRHAITLSVAHGELALRRRWRTGRSLRDQAYTRAIVLPRSLKAALPAMAARIPVRTGYRGEFRYGLLNDIRPLNKKRLYRTVDRFVNLGLPPGSSLPDPIPQPRLQIPVDGPEKAAASLGLEIAEAPVLALCPGADDRQNMGDVPDRGEPEDAQTGWRRTEFSHWRSPLGAWRTDRGIRRASA